MTDVHLVIKLLAGLETYVRELKTLCRPEKIGTDVREERFVEHTLQLAIQAALDVASHIVSDDRLGEPRTNRQLFELLARNGWISAELGEALRQIVGFRNILVHGYSDVDLEIVRRIVEEDLDDLTGFSEAIRARLAAYPGADSEPPVSP
jgi:uncharacterized protein YutE (UPF0331/DUF86 family)